MSELMASEKPFKKFKTAEFEYSKQKSFLKHFMPEYKRGGTSCLKTPLEDEN